MLYNASMNKQWVTVLAALSLLFALGGTAVAQDDSGGTPAAGSGSSSSGGIGKTGMGLGAEAMLSGLVGPTFIYDASAWRISGTLLINDDGNDTTVGLGGRFWFSLHNTSASDFSVGGGASLVDNDGSVFAIEGGAQLRAFVVENVALSGTIGINLFLGDADGFGTGGQLIGSVGVAYFFY